MVNRHRRAGIVAFAFLLVTASAAAAGPGREPPKELFPGEGVGIAQHGMTEGHLPAVRDGVKLIGKAEVVNPAGSGNDGRVADVSAYVRGRLPHPQVRPAGPPPGVFIDEGGKNFWGVEVHKIRGEQYVLASDRDFGLYIFQPGK